MIGGLGKHDAKRTAAEMLFELCDDASNRTKREVYESVAERGRVGTRMEGVQVR